MTNPGQEVQAVWTKSKLKPWFFGFHVLWTLSTSFPPQLQNYKMKIQTLYLLGKKNPLIGGSVTLKPVLFRGPCAGVLSHVRLSVTPWTVAFQAPLSAGFSRQEYWSGLPIPSPGDLPDPGIKPTSMSPALASGFFLLAPPGKPFI